MLLSPIVPRRLLLPQLIAVTSDKVDSGSVLTLPVPTSQPGDVVLVGYASAAAATVTVPGHWTLVRNEGNGKVYAFVVGAGEPATHDITSSTTGTWSGGMASFRYVQAVQPIAASAGDAFAGSVNVVGPSITVPIPNALLAWFATWLRSAPNQGSVTAPPGMAAQWDISATSASLNNRGSGMATESLPLGGATGTRTGTLNTSLNGTVSMVALFGAPVATPPLSFGATWDAALRRVRHQRRARVAAYYNGFSASAGTLGGGAVFAEVSGGLVFDASADLSIAATSYLDLDASAALVFSASAEATLEHGAVATAALTPDASTAAVLEHGAEATAALVPTASGVLVLTASVPATRSGWRVKVRAAGPRWTLAWRPVMSPALFPPIASPANDSGIVIDSITGYAIPSGAGLTYDGASLEAWWASAPESDVPLGGVTVTALNNGTVPAFVVAFEAAQMTTALANLPDSAPVWLVVKGTDDFRVAIEHTVRRARTTG